MTTSASGEPEWPGVDPVPADLGPTDREQADLSHAQPQAAQLQPQPAQPQPQAAQPQPQAAQLQPNIAPPIAPGPGVTPPFAAPPREGRQRRLGIGLAIGGVVLLLCCGGGAAGFVTLVVAGTHQRVNAARTVVTSYMNDWRKQDYAGAYQLLCDNRKSQVTVGEFTESLSDSTVVEFSVDQPVVRADGVDVQVRVNFDDGSDAEPIFTVVQDKTGDSLICDQS